MKKQITLLFVVMFFTVKNLLAVDLDGNGIQDYNEQILANMFCPCLVLEGQDGGVSPEPVEIMETTSEKLWMRVFNIEPRFVFEKQVFEGANWEPPVSYWHASLDYDKNYSWFNEDAFSYEGQPPGYAYGKYFLQIHYEWAGQGNNPSAWRAAYASEATTNAHKDRVYANLWKKGTDE